MSRYYNGPVSDHFNGERFFDSQAAPPRSRLDLLRWLLVRRWRGTRAEWPAWAPSPFADRPPQRVTGAACRVSYVGHASFLIQTAGLNVLLDPVWSPRASPFRNIGPKRVNDPGVAFADLPQIDVVLVSHAHYDHLDLVTLSRLAASHRPRVITPLGNDTILAREVPGLTATAVDWDHKVDLGDGLIVHVEPTVHWSARGVGDRRHALWASFVLEAGANKIYCIGDTGFADGKSFRRVRERHPELALALVPIGAYEPRWFMCEQHMNPREAVQAHLALEAHLSVGCHFGCFQLTDEGIDEPQLALEYARSVLAVPPSAFQVPLPGQTMLWHR